MQILKTKLLTPPLPAQTLLRPRLYERLRPGLNRRLTVISAGPGWGKSVLLASFFQSQHIPHVWYGLDERDRDPVFFLAYLAEGMRKEFGGVGGKTLSALRSAGQGGVVPDSLVSILLNEILDALPQEIPVVLDDYRQTHSNNGINAVLLRLVRHAPPNLHLFLLTRERPALDLGRLKVQGEIIELDGEDLRFTENEIRDLFKTTRGANLSPVDADRLRTRTDGWAMGLRMALETLSEREDPREPIPSLSRTIGPGDALFAYFEEEVFRSLPAGMQEFLTFTSIPDRFTAELCDTLTGAGGSRDILLRLVQEDFFIVRLDKKSKWYRYHHLFREFLGTLLRKDHPEETVSSLYQRAASWFREKRIWPEAISCALEAGDVEGAADGIEQTMDELMASAAVETLLYWLDRIPDHVAETRPALLFGRGWAGFFTGRWNEAYAHLEKALSLALEQEDQAVLEKILHVLMGLHYQRGDHHGVDGMARSHAQHLEPRSPLTLNCALIHAASLMYLNRRAEAREIWEEIRNHPLVQGDRFLYMNTVSFMGPHYYLPLGEFRKALALTQEALDFFRHHDYMGRYGQFLGFMGHIRHEMGEFVESRRLFEEMALELREKGVYFVLNAAYNMIAVNSFLSGDPQTALRALDESERILARFDTHALFKAHTLNMARALSAFHRGNSETFSQEADEAMRVAGENGDPWDLYQFSCLLGPGYATFGREETARQLLLNALKSIEGLGSAYGAARCRLLLASLALEHGHDREAKRQLRESLALCETHNYGFLFSRRERIHGAALIPWALAERIRPRYLKRLVLEFGAALGPSLLPLLQHPDPRVRRDALDALAGLGHREAAGPAASLRNDPDPRIKVSAEKTVRKLHSLPPMPLNVLTLGPFRLFQGEREIPRRAWPRKISRSLFKFLLHHRDRAVTTELLQETFFPDMDPAGSRHILHQAVSALRSVLEPGISPRARSAYLESEDGSYHLVLPEGSRVDVLEFEADMRRAEEAMKEGDAHRAFSCFEAAIDLYRGDFLEEDPYEEWCSPPRETYRGLYVHALREKAAHTFEHFDYPPCIATLRTLLRHEEWDEEACVMLIKCHLSVGNRTAALKAFRKFRDRLRADLDVAPGTELRQLYESLFPR